MTSDERKLRDLLSEVLEKHQQQVSVNPAWLATEAMLTLDPDKKAPQLVYQAAHLHMRQIARQLCRVQFGDDDGEGDQQHQLFPNLQARYPTPKEKGIEPEYVKLEGLTLDAVTFNVERLRHAAEGLQLHADRLEAWGLTKFAA